MLQGEKNIPPVMRPKTCRVCVCAMHVLCVMESGRLNTVCANSDSFAIPELRGVSLYVCVCLHFTVLSPLKSVKELFAK